MDGLSPTQDEVKSNDSDSQLLKGLFSSLFGLFKSKFVLGSTDK